MPTKLLPNKEDFTLFEKKMKEIGYRAVTKEDFKKTFERLGLRAPRHKPGQEAGFYYPHTNGLTAYVWTTFLRKEGVSREEDSGWVLIAEGDNALYFAPPMRRIEGFIKKMLQYAWVAAWRVAHRPLCPVCKRYMEVARGKGLKSRYWRCLNRTVHPVMQRLSWDEGLPPKALGFLKGERKKRSTYRETRRAQGKTVGTAMLTRRPWEVRNARNRLVAHV